MRIIIIDDDERLCAVLARRFTSLGNIQVDVFHDPRIALEAEKALPTYAILLDMMLGDDLGLHFVAQLKSAFKPEHLVMMTGYASIATTVEAMRLGASNYIAKPVSFNELLQHLEIQHTASSGNGQHHSIPTPGEQKSDSATKVMKPMTSAQAEWEHIQRVLILNKGNISSTAKALGMHRRSLQRKLQKYSPIKE